MLAVEAATADAGTLARFMLLGAILVIALGTGAALAIVLRRGSRLRREAQKPRNPADRTPQISAWYEAGKRARPEPEDNPEDEDQNEDNDHPSPFR